MKDIPLNAPSPKLKSSSAINPAYHEETLAYYRDILHNLDICIEAHKLMHTDLHKEDYTTKLKGYMNLEGESKTEALKMVEPLRAELAQLIETYGEKIEAIEANPARQKQLESSYSDPRAAAVNKIRTSLTTFEQKIEFKRQAESNWVERDVDSSFLYKNIGTHVFNNTDTKDTQNKTKMNSYVNQNEHWLGVAEPIVDAAERKAADEAAEAKKGNKNANNQHI